MARQRRAVRWRRGAGRALRQSPRRGEDGWSYGRITQLHAGKSTGFISNIRAERIYFHQDQLTDTTWRPEVGSRVRFHCANVVQSQDNRVTAYRALDISEVDPRVTLREFA